MMKTDEAGQGYKQTEVSQAVWRRRGKDNGSGWTVGSQKARVYRYFEREPHRIF